MNVLFVADPGSIHDRRWMHALTADAEMRGFFVCRTVHRLRVSTTDLRLGKNVAFIGSIEDASVIRPWRNFLQLIKLRRAIRRHAIDVLHVLYAEPNALWLFWVSFLGIPAVITTRGTDVLKTIPRFFNSKSILHRIVAGRYKVSFNNAAHIFCTSETQVRSVRSMGVRPQITLARTGIDLGYFSNLAPQATCTKYGITRQFILMPRAMRPLYNHEFTLSAIDLLPDDLKSRYAFIFLNADTDDQAYFRKILTRSEGINAEFRFLHSVSHCEFLALCQAASLVVMNPVSDGSPVSAMEAMACRVPVILPPLDYDTELMEFVWFFTEWKPESLTDVIQNVLSFDRSALVSRLQLNFQNVMKYGVTKTEMLKVKNVYDSLVR